MWWILAAKAGIGAAMTAAGTEIAKINTHLSEVQARTSNSIRMSQNEIVASRNTLARFMQSLNNNKRLKAGGEALDAATTNYLRENDALIHASFGDQIRYMEQAGAAHASQAASGVTGNVADMVNGATALRNSQIQQRFEDANASRASDEQKRAAGIHQQMVDGLDSSVIFDHLDYSQDFSTKYIAPNWLGGALSALGGGGAQASVIDISDAAKKGYNSLFNSSGGGDYNSKESSQFDSRRSAFAREYDTGEGLGTSSINTSGAESGSSFSANY